MSGTQQRFVIFLRRSGVTNIRYVWDPAETTVMRKVQQSGTYPTGETNNAALATIVNMGDDTDSDFYRPIETAKNLAENL